VSASSRRMAGLLLLLMPTVVVGGTSILTLLAGDTGYAENELRQDLWRAGHAHAGVLLVLSLVALRYVDEANLTAGLKSLVRHSIPAAAILLPAAFFLSVPSPETTEPNALIHLAYPGALSLATGLLGWASASSDGPRTPERGETRPKEGNRRRRHGGKGTHEGSRQSEARAAFARRQVARGWEPGRCASRPAGG